jgi:hypothetical protein
LTALNTQDPLRQQASKIQEAYLAKRRKAINKQSETRRQAVDEVLIELARKNGITNLNVHTVYNHIHARLQESPLTINLEAGSWFLDGPNTYQTYATMYQKAYKDGVMVLKDAPKGNGVFARTKADDIVTLPEEWRDAKRSSKKKQIWDAMSVTGGATANQRGYQAQKRQYDVKDEGKSLQRVDANDKTKGYITTNRKFNPHTKQVFAALNYGPRAQGSSTYYGYSYLILKPALKESAIYFAQDTFGIEMKYHWTALYTQVTYETVGAVLAYAPDNLLDDVWKSCYEDQTVEDTESAERLLEAHLFQELRFDRDVESLVLSRKRQSDEKPFSTDEWNSIKENAYAWGQQSRVRVLLTSL